MDNYACKDNYDPNIHLIIKDPNYQTVIVTGYPLALKDIYRGYINYVYIPYIQDDYTLRLIYNFYGNKVFKTLEDYQRVNNSIKGIFVVLNMNEKSYSFYNFETYREKIIKFFHDITLTKTSSSTGAK